MAILYLCDRKACKKCHDNCKHTSNISHAVNFEEYHIDGVGNGDFIEKEHTNLAAAYPSISYSDYATSDMAVHSITNKADCNDPYGFWSYTSAAKGD